MKKFGFLALVLVFTLIWFNGSKIQSQSASSDLPPGSKVPNSYIVVVRDSYVPEKVAATLGVAPTHFYSAALNGFATQATAKQVAAMEHDARVAYVEPDIMVSMTPPASQPVVWGQVTSNGIETMPTGINRIDAELNSRTDVSSVGIAIIDTGIWLKHTDLNVAGQVSFVTGVRSGNDDNGHGTHVAGIAAAKTSDNYGVRGVAPNARLFAVKVLNKYGSGNLSWIIAGVDWVTKNAAANKIHVANMSLGFEGSSSAFNDAIHKMVATANVTTVVAAGNSAKDASTFSPANHPDVIAISALADSDGKCGAIGPATSYGADDTLATFSNFGATVVLAAPGVDILSTWMGDRKNQAGSYATLSGTSMASPHVTGAAAQYIASQLLAGKTFFTFDVKGALLQMGTPQTQTCDVDSTGRTRGGFTGDKDTSPEPLVDAGSL